MANRHLSRSIALQTLFEWDFRGYHKEQADAALKRNAEEFAPGIEDVSFAEEIARGVLKKKVALDEIITKAAPEWPLDRISLIDRNILRIGLYELLFLDRAEVPPKVAINEAIELGKTFGGDTSGRFVNGVLGAVYKELGEPGKEEKAGDRSKKPYDTSLPREKMPVKKLAGAVVYARHNGEISLAFVHDVFGRWTLSKGGIEEGEKEEDGARRKIKEEIGLDIEIQENLGVNEYVAHSPDEGKYRKSVRYFLAESPYQELKLEEGKGGLDDARWFKMGDILELNFYDDVLPILTKGIGILSQEQKEKA